LLKKTDFGNRICGLLRDFYPKHATLDLSLSNRPGSLRLTGRGGRIDLGRLLKAKFLD